MLSEHVFRVAVRSRFPLGEGEAVPLLPKTGNSVGVRRQGRGQSVSPDQLGPKHFDALNGSQDRIVQKSEGSSALRRHRAAQHFDAVRVEDHVRIHLEQELRRNLFRAGVECRVKAHNLIEDVNALRWNARLRIQRGFTFGKSRLAKRENDGGDVVGNGGHFGGRSKNLHSVSSLTKTSMRDSGGITDGSGPASPVRVVVTGASGFLGRAFFETARSWSFAIEGLARTAGHRRSHRIHPVDLRDPVALRDFIARFDPTHVLHLAAARQGTSAEIRSTNVLGTRNLAEVLQGGRSFRKLVLVSSSAVYGTRDSRPMAEDAPIRPEGEYARTKAEQERIVRTGLGSREVIVVRPFNVIGPGAPSHLLPGTVAEQIASAEREGGGEIVLGDLSGVRDFVDVRDVAEALGCLITTEIGSGTFNVCSGRRMEIRTFVQHLVLKSRVPIDLKTRGRSVPANPTCQVGTSDRLRRATGWHPKVGFEQSLEDLLAAARDSLSRAW